VAYDEDLADRIRELVARERGLTEKRMFGGLAFLLDGTMAVSASSRGGLMVRVDPAASDDLVADPRAERMVMKGRPMDGWLHVDADGLDDARLAEWVARGVTYARSLPSK
jgi:TfoX/Sxy family transcriptional regulator of competence genes